MTRVVAHRTCGHDVAENSVEGIRLAAALGADLVELDVRLTRDGVPVLMHDHTAWRTTRRPLVVRRTGARRLAAVRLRNGAGPPTFAAVLDALPDHLGVAVDLKVPAAAGPVVALARRAGVLDRLELWCRGEAAVAGLARVAPGTRRALLAVRRDVPRLRGLLDAADRAGAHAISLPDRYVTPELVARAHALGIDVYAWVRSLPAHERVLAAGVAAVVTGWPREALRLLGRSAG